MLVVAGVPTSAGSSVERNGLSRRPSAKVRNHVGAAHHHAREAREQDARRQEALADVRALMSEILDGPPEFVDLGVISDYVP